MTLFTAEGLMGSSIHGRYAGLVCVKSRTSGSYLRWLSTQGIRSPLLEEPNRGWLVTHQELFSQRAPGNTCISALKGMEFFGQAALNDSKGCGAVMRMAPVGLFISRNSKFSREHSRFEAFELGCELAGLTHGHPTGQIAAGAFAVLILELAKGSKLSEALSIARTVVVKYQHHKETLLALELPEKLAANSLEDDANIACLGEGWIAESALAIGVYCALRAKNLEEGIIKAVNITGDSDSTGSIAGNFFGAMYGVHEIPDKWLSSLELRNVLTEVADDLAIWPEWPIHHHAFHPVPENSDEAKELEYWLNRYPAG